MARRPLRAGRRMADDEDDLVPVWRTAPALVAYGLVGLLIVGIAALQLTYEPASTAETPDAPARVAVDLPQPSEPEAAPPPPIENDETVSTDAPEPAEASQGGSDSADAAEPVPRDDDPAPRDAAAATITGEAPAAEPPRTAVPSAALAALPGKLVLPPAPDPDLQISGRFGPLPAVAEDGREPWQVYARPFPTERDRPRIAILLQDLGLSRDQTNAAIQGLPGSITLGFTPYARDLADWIALSRAAGHEVMLQIPMEPFDFPTSDPGPHTLLTSAGAGQNQERLEFLLSRVSGYVGVYNRMGDRFTSSTESVRPVLQAIQERGLLFLDARTSGTSVAGRIAADLQLPHALNNRELDQVASRVEIDAKLIDLENIARQEGIAVGIGRAYPVTLERLAQWAATLEEKGIDLAPVSAVSKK